MIHNTYVHNTNFGPLFCLVQQKQRTGYWPLFRCCYPTRANRSVSLWVLHQIQPDLQSSEFVTTSWMTIFTIPPPVVLNRGMFVDDKWYSPNLYTKFDMKYTREVSGLNHTNEFSFENALFSIRFHLGTTLQRSKTEAFVFRNGDIWKRFWIRRHLKTHRYVLMWLHKNGAFQKRCRHDDAFFPAKTPTPLSKHELNKKRVTK